MSAWEGSAAQERQEDERKQPRERIPIPSVAHTGPVIEKGVPLPRGHGDRNGVTATLKLLEVGDSVVFISEAQLNPSNIIVSANRIGIKVATRKVEGGRRVWRVK